MSNDKRPPASKTPSGPSRAAPRKSGSGDMPTGKAPTGKAPTGDRIAKVLARAGVASRREAERMVEEGRITVNGVRIDSPALNVTPRDKVLVDGQSLAPPEPARLWLYHKPTGLVTTERDEKGRETVFETLPPDMPRVMSVGRLDINSEGLLLLTNDGGLKRRLELPSTGWLRKYRVRVNGRPSDADLAPLRAGIVVEGEKFQPMVVAIDRQQGANAWLTVGIREGRNREVRRAMEHVNLVVNRLIRVSYGPFQLGPLAVGGVEEVKARVLRDQLGEGADLEGLNLLTENDGPTKRPMRAKGAGPIKAAAPAKGAKAPAGRPATGPASGRPGKGVSLNARAEFDAAPGPRGGKRAADTRTGEKRTGEKRWDDTSGGDKRPASRGPAPQGFASKNTGAKSAGPKGSGAAPSGRPPAKPRPRPTRG